MNNLNLSAQVQRMMVVIHQIPIGLIETDLQGNVQQINAKGVQLMLPLFFEAQLPPTNLLDLLNKIAPALIEKIQLDIEETGNIINQENYQLIRPAQAEDDATYFMFSVNKINTETLMFTFDDISEMYKREQLISQALQDKAVEQSKYEIASGVLHDVGNAVVGFGSYITKIKRSLEHSEIGTLQNLKQFMVKQNASLAAALGEAKAKALVELLGGVIDKMEADASEVKKSLAEQLNIILHIQEILNIQRQYVKGQSAERLPVNLRSILNDSIAMLLASFDKKDIKIKADIPVNVPEISGDRTRLMQVILNLLKNAVESVMAASVSDKLVQVVLTLEEHAIQVKIIDNGLGFEGGSGDRFFERGVTSKQQGTGLGLANCKSIIESHNGTIELLSRGPGLGATAVITFQVFPVVP